MTRYNLLSRLAQVSPNNQTKEHLQMEARRELIKELNSSIDVKKSEICSVCIWKDCINCDYNT